MSRHGRLVADLWVRDLTRADLPWCGWAGTALHLASVARELDRAAAGEVEYLAVCPPSGLPIGIGGVDFTMRLDSGHLYQLAVLPALQSCGVGTLLVGELENRVVARGGDRAELGVEEGNARARALYERLGYVVYGRERDAWDAEGEDGTVVRYETMCTMMAKPLRRP